MACSQMLNYQGSNSLCENQGLMLATYTVHGESQVPQTKTQNNKRELLENT